ncbi:unnamed protein product [Mytilus edulis]|uniref:Uncharacterized protein n=1 Tax=Mytilus edulis TaxID=6550 RepID=A0A8S3Q1D3_MYTED|nr:unnamed protein product [Mytilus edulis]
MKSKIKQAQTVSGPSKHVENMQLLLEKKVVVPRPGKSKFGLVTGCVVFQNKHFLFSYCDTLYSNNSCLSLLDENGSKIFYLKPDRIGISPCDIAVINETTVAITTPKSSKSIVIFNIETRMVSKVIDAQYGCFGISLFESSLIYSCGEGGIEMRSLDTGNVYPFKFGSFTSNEYVTVFKNKIYSTDSSSDTVTCFDMEGKVH